MADNINNYKGCFLNSQEIILNSIEDVESGNKLIVNELANGGRVVQFFGNFELKGKLVGFVDLPLRNQIEGILNTQEKVLLELPFGESYWIFISKVSSSLYFRDSIGIFKFSFDFCLSAFSSDNQIIPTRTQIAITGDSLNVSLLQKAKDFIVKTALTIAKLRAKVSSAITEIQSALNTIKIASDQINSINTSLGEIENTLDALISAPINLVNSINSVIESSINSIDNIKDKYNFIITLINGNNTNTNDYALSLIDATIISSCVKNYSQTIDLNPFVYDYEIQACLEQLKVLKAKADFILDKSLKNINISIINKSIILLNEKAEFTKRKKTHITELPTTESLLCYNIYGNLDNLDNLRNWNNITQYGFIEKGTEIKFYV